MRRFKRLLQAALMGGIMMCASPAMAQDEPPPEFHDVPVIENQKPYIQWIVGLLFVAACIGIGMKNPARTHLD